MDASLSGLPGPSLPLTTTRKRPFNVSEEESSHLPEFIEDIDEYGIVMSRRTKRHMHWNLVDEAYRSLLPPKHIP